MPLNFNEIYEIFEKSKEIHDLKEYLDEIQKNNEILSAWQFNVQEAIKQISKLTGKYRAELNFIAKLQNNGMYVTNQFVRKTDEQIKSDLQYINSLIPLFALERKAITNYLNQQIQRGFLND